MNMLPSAHPQNAELIAEVELRGMMTCKGYFYASLDSKHGLWFDTVLVSADEDW